jgi:hypothetical protein
MSNASMKMKLYYQTFSDERVKNRKLNPVNVHRWSAVCKPLLNLTNYMYENKHWRLSKYIAHGLQFIVTKCLLAIR